MENLNQIYNRLKLSEKQHPYKIKIYQSNWIKHSITLDFVTIQLKILNDWNKTKLPNHKEFYTSQKDYITTQTYGQYKRIVLANTKCWLVVNENNRVISYDNTKHFTNQ